MSAVGLYQAVVGYEGPGGLSFASGWVVIVCWFRERVLMVLVGGGHALCCLVICFAYFRGEMGYRL